MAAKPAILFSGGAFHMPAHFGPIIAKLTDRGYEASAIKLPSLDVEGEEDVPDYEDARTIRAKAQALADQGKDVILVCHSMSGCPGCQAVKGLEKSARQAQGLPGGIVKIIFICALVIPEGTTILEVMTAGGQALDWLETDGPTATKAGPAAAKTFFSDLSDEEQQRWYRELRRQHNKVITTPVKDACWDVDVAKVYVHTTNDPCSPVEYQKGLLEKVINETHWTVKSIHSDHAPFLSHIDELIPMLVE